MLVEQLITDMHSVGWSARPGFLTHDESERLRQECALAYENGGFRPAGVGHGAGLKIREDIRKDQVMWIDPGEQAAERHAYLGAIERIREKLNQRFFLGLFDYEAHFAIYPEGAYYKAHLDRHVGSSARLVTVILYLNDAWQPGDGGELKIWTTPQGCDGAFELIEPRMGTLVTFFSGDFWHEVLPTKKPRMSITGWYRARD